MGNTVCTERVPLTLDDLRPGKDVPQLTVAERTSFARFDHNIKVLRVAQGEERCSVRCFPVPLHAAPSFDTDSVYIALHIARDGAAPPSAAGEVGGATGGGGTPSDTSNMDWAVHLSSSATPRGLAHPFSVDLQGMRWRSPTLRDNFSVHVYVFRGAGASKYVGAMAMVHAMEVERRVVHDNSFVEALFHNAASRNPSARCVPAAVVLPPGGGLGGSPSPPLQERDRRALYRANALLRALHGVAVEPQRDAVQQHVDATTASLTPVTATAGTAKPLTAANDDVATTAAPVHPAPPTRPTDGDGAHTTLTRVPTLRMPAVGAASPSRASDAAPASLSRRELDSPADGAAEPASSAHSAGPGLTLPLEKLPALNLPQNRAVSPTPAEARKDGASSCKSKVSDDEWEGGDDGAFADPNERQKRLRAAAPQVTEVLPFLFVGGELASQDRRQLLEKGIAYIVNAAAIALPNSFPDLFEYTDLMLADSPDEDITALFPQIIALIENARINNQRVFIHCHQGVSRSCTLVLAYVMWHRGMCYDEAFAFVRERRNICSPNAGFMVALLRWERWLSMPDAPAVVLWRYVPYNDEYLFPLCFRVVEPDVEGKVHLDPVTSYACLVAGEDVVQFHAGADCPEEIATHAYNAISVLVHFSFYRGPARESADTKGRRISFSPKSFGWTNIKQVDGLTLMSSASRVVASSGKSATAVLGAVPPASGDPGDHTTKMRHLLDAMTQPGFLERFVDHEEELALVAEGAARRKRKRENPSPDRPAAGDGDVGTSSAAGSAGGGGGGGSAPDTAYIAEEGEDPMSVIPFPFDQGPITVYDYDDLASDCCYAIRILGNRSGTRKPMTVLWVGADFDEGEDAGVEAFDDLLRTSPFFIPPLHVCGEGDEPEQLMGLL